MSKIMGGNKKNQIITIDNIQKQIFTVRGKQVMLDSDLAKLYDVSTGRLNEQVKRNIERFPQDFMFQLTKKEWDEIFFKIAKCDLKHRKRKTPQIPLSQTVSVVANFETIQKSIVRETRTVQIKATGVFSCIKCSTNCHQR